MGGKHINTRMASLTKVANLVESKILFCDTFEKDAPIAQVISSISLLKLN